ncbi:hypothetical protein EV207_11472 [Scopulibacillus darangshiensis]|uniref:Uncharacterized protein n=1 Tax=Scopulibacillus darangshiensis TaxID=442528 RepID=A0A4R2P2Z7_9BACL|nr:hypothetical protein EV207_11472 [Scopulibacillus darangshiensis]
MFFCIVIHPPCVLFPFYEIAEKIQHKYHSYGIMISKKQLSGVKLIKLHVENGKFARGDTVLAREFC